VQIYSGSATFTAGGVTVPLEEKRNYVKTKDRPLGISSEPEEETVSLKNITEPNERTTPGRWDKNYSHKFEMEVKRLDSVPGLSIAEYVRDSKRRGELKLEVFDLKAKQAEYGIQIADFQKDVDGFKTLKETLHQAVDAETKKERSQRREEYKQASQVLAQAQRSLKGLQKELQNLMVDVRKSQEYLAAIPIVRMLNITAEESTIPFEKSRSLVPESATPTLDSIAEGIMNMKPFRVVVEGHTDKTGSNAANIRLSKQRAEAVAQYLHRRTSYPTRAFITKGMGSKQPLTDEDSPEGFAKNRRVEIWFELRGL
jgi:outer membrane protein OmpA-like peptidoglycan-associated protein